MDIGSFDLDTEAYKGSIWRVGSTVVGFGSTILFARLLTADAFGTYHLVLAVVTFLINIVTGWGVACKKRISEDGFPVQDAFGSGILLIVIVTVISSVLFVLFQQLSGITIVSIEYLLPMAVLLISLSYFDFLEKILQTKANFSISFRFTAIQTMVRSVIQVTLVLVGLGISGMLYGFVAANLFMIVPMYRTLRISPRIPSFTAFEDILRFATYSIFNKYAGSARFQASTVIAGTLLSSEAAGIYQVAFKLSNPIIIVATVLGAGLMPRISYMESVDGEFVDSINKSLWISSILGIPILFGAISIGPSVITSIYGAEYYSGTPILVFLAGFWTLNGFNKQLFSVLNGVDKPELNFKIKVFALIIFIFGGFLLAPRYGLIGIVFTLVLSEGSLYLFSAFYVKQEMSAVRLLSKPIFEQVGAGITMFAVLEGIKKLIISSGLIPTSVLIVVGGFVYFVVLFGISTEFRLSVLRTIN